MHIRRETTVGASLDRTFAFFADAANLEQLTPEWLRFEIATRMPVAMRQGATIDYRIRWHELPIPWRSHIEVWEPGARFVDRQVIGPYRWWRHEHRFEEVPGGTRVTDEVEFLPRIPWLTSRIVARDVEQIFSYRQDRLREIFGG